MKILHIFILILINSVASQDEGLEILSVNVDGLLMENAIITSSATCGLKKPEVYCKLVDESSIPTFNQERNVLCDICDENNATKRHPIEYAKSDDDNLWWQSPSMAQGLMYQNVNVTIDLKQVYQIVYILLKMGDSPRPGNWVLERSLNGETYIPWIFFAETPYSCYNLFQRHYPLLQLTTSAKPNVLEDDEMFCTTYYSQHRSLNSGEIIISLINGRKSLMSEDDGTFKSIPQKLINFLSARFIRFRFLKHLTLAADLMTPKGVFEHSIYNRYFYSLRNIEIGGKCICNNHADKCDKVLKNGIPESKCICKHNTCGSNCETCCPLFNQKPWRPVVPCEECNCNRKSNECVYNQTIATLQMSTNKMGRMEGGGVCINCQENTEGINCEKCKRRFYRPWDVLATAQYPCKPCVCNGIGTVGDCVSNGEEIDNQMPGDCICKAGYTGKKCDVCSTGYERYSNGQCFPCPCSLDGSVSSSLYRCKPPCNCKINVEPDNECKTCKNDFFNLDIKNPEGCQPCYCFGITNQCTSLNAKSLQINELKNWKLSTINGDKIANPKLTALQYLYSENSYLDKLFNNPLVYYWVAPQPFLGNWLTSYGSIFRYVVKIELASINEGSQIDSPDVIIKCKEMRLFHSISSEERRLQRQVQIYVKENYWKSGKINPEKETTKDEFITCLVNVESVMIKAKYYSNQNTIELLNITLSRGDPQLAFGEMAHIEKCNCPQGFSGLSCESCVTGHRRVNNVLFRGTCEPCLCNNHSNTCDPMTGECLKCQNNTTGTECDECISGFYGYPKQKQKDSCKKCACPLLDYQKTDQCSPISAGVYICHDCMENTIGPHCERCVDGFYGNPLKKIQCRYCECNDNQESCSSITGECKCSFNTMGSECQFCIQGYFGNALNKTCKQCDCNTIGSKNQNCDKTTGQCDCRTKFVNKNCNSCAPGLYLKDGNCIPCDCNSDGRIQSETFCNSTSGQCYCRKDINGETCNQCMSGFYDYPLCKKCQCSSHSLSSECDKNSGECKCGKNVDNDKCDKCIGLHYWKNNTDCEPCNCGKGSVSNICDMETGNCYCSTNVITRNCNRCQIGYYGLSSFGCRKCPACFNGTICNNDGNCVCPPNTVGERCGKCAEDSWEYKITMGCKKCDCDSEGSNSQKCDSIYGKCQCKPQFQGEKCKECNDGFYGFPKCDPCNCERNGTKEDKLFNCHSITGKCQCKENVMGDKCNICKKGTFPSTDSYNAGCFSCFCFGLSNKCQPLLNYRLVEYTVKEYEIFDNIQSFESGKDYGVIKLNLAHSNKFGWPISMFRPVYVDVLQLLKSSDLSLFYKSTIMKASIACLDSKCGRDNTIQHVVIMESYNGLFELRYMVNYSTSNTEEINIEFDEQSKNGKWFISKYKNDTLNQFIFMDDPYQININLTRDIFMMALLNVTSLKIQLYTENINPQLVKLRLVINDVIETMAKIGKPITAIEKCKCISITSGNNCQNPIAGYYKQSLSLPDININLNLRFGNRIRVTVLKCDCNGHSTICNRNTGACQNCSNNTIGKKCELCNEGFYGNPKNNVPCQSCQCPTKKYNFAKSCTNGSSISNFKCNCKKGYTGLLCERCEFGFYGNPSNGLPCKACDCNVEGSENVNCDSNGVCQCAAGVFGVKCDQCEANYVVENKKCTSCYSGCTKTLFQRLDNFNNSLINLKSNSRSSNINLKIKEMNFNKQIFSNNLLVFYKFQNVREGINNFSTDIEIIKENSKVKLNEAIKLQTQYYEAFEQLLSIFNDINETISGDKQLGSSDDIINNATKYINIIKDMLNEMPNTSDVNKFLTEVRKHILEINKSINKTQSFLQSDKLINLSILKNKTVMANDINIDNQAYTTALKMKNEEYDLQLSLMENDIKKIQNDLLTTIVKKNEFQMRIYEMQNKSKMYQINLENMNILIEIMKESLKNISNNGTGSKKLIIPDKMKIHVEEQLNKSAAIIRNLTKEFNFLQNAEQAKEAYSNISRDILEVDKAINITQQQLDNSKSVYNVNTMAIYLVDLIINKSNLELKKNNVTNIYENFTKQSENLKRNQLKIEMANIKLDPKIPRKSYDIELLKKNITKVKNEQLENEKLISSVNKTLNDFQIPNIVDGVKTQDIDKLVQNVTTQYKEMVNDAVYVKDKIQKLREKIKSLKERLYKARIMTELTHGAAARSSEPIRHVERCVRRYVTYYLPKSNAFSLEFYMKPQFYDQQSLVLFGYDDLGSSPHSFAFTIEGNNQYKFWYEYEKTVESIQLQKVLNKNSYVGVLITWKLGKWEMQIRSVNNDKDTEDKSQSKHNVTINNNIRIGPQTNVFIGGYPSSKLLDKIKLEGKLMSLLKESYDNNFYKGCIYGIKLMNSEFGLQDIEAVDEECKKMITVDQLLLQTFNCKFNWNSSIIFSDSNLENINKFKTSIKRQKRNILKEFDIHLSGNGYGMINTSKVRQGNCKSKLNKVLSISTESVPVMNNKTFQLIAVFANLIKNFGFVLGHTNEQYHFGFWKTDQERKLVKLQNVTDDFKWNIFKSNIVNLEENLFGIEEICDQNSFIYLGDIPYYEFKLVEKLKRLNVPNFGFTGKMKLSVSDKNVFHILATRFINIIFMQNERMLDAKFHSLFISNEVNQLVELNDEFISDSLKYGFSFNVDFLGIPLSKNFTLLTIETTNANISIIVSKDLVFSLLINTISIDKQLAMDYVNWGTHYLVVNFNFYDSQISRDVSLMVDNDDEVKMLGISIDIGQYKRTTIGSFSNSRQSFYIYNLFLGQKFVDFSYKVNLPPGVFLKQNPTPLQPGDFQSIRKDYFKPPHLRSQTYPMNSAWFDGISNNLMYLTNEIIDKYRHTNNMLINEVSFMIRSASLRPEILISLNFGLSKTLYIITIGGQIMLYDSETKWTASFPVRLINEEWHTIRVTSSSQDIQRGIRVYQNNHIFDFPNAPLTFTMPILIEIGASGSSNLKLIYKNKNYQLQYFTGCIDEFKINNKTIQFLNGNVGNNIKQCPRVLEFLQSGGHILDTYTDNNDKNALIKMKTGNYAISLKDNTYLTKFKFKYTGFENGNILITGFKDKYCAITIKNKEIIITYQNFKTGEGIIESIKILTEKWYKIIFVVYHYNELFSTCKMFVDDNEVGISLSGDQMFDKDFQKPKIYFGGFPDLSVQNKFILTQNKKNFVGCISDLTFLVNDQFVQSEFEKSEYFIGGRCSIDKNTYLLKYL